MVFQRPNPFPTMTIAENVLAGVRLNDKRISKAQAEDLIEGPLSGANLWDEVKDRLDKPGSSLFGGQQQRLCIARAIAIKPDVLLGRTLRQWKHTLPRLLHHLPLLQRRR